MQELKIGRKNHIIESLPAELVKNIQNIGEPLYIKKNEFIYEENDKADKVYFINEGYINIGHTSPDNKKNLKVIMQSGDIFGILCLIGQRYRKNFASAKSDVFLLSFPYELVEQELKKFPDIHIEVVKMISRKIIEYEERMELWQYLSAEKRIMDWLKELVLEKAEITSEGNFQIQFPYSHSEIGALTNSSRQTVCSVLTKYKKSGQLKTETDLLTIFDINSI